MKELLTKLGSIGVAFLASLCCTGPLILAGLGIGGAGIAAGLAEYRLHLMGLTVLKLSAAFYYTYRKREVICDDGSRITCRGSEKSKRSLWVVTAFVLILFSVPYLNLGTTGPTDINRAGIQTTFKIEGMTCSGCEAPVELALRKLEGVNNVEASYAERQVTIYHTTTIPGENVIKQELIKIGYNLINAR